MMRNIVFLVFSIWMICVDISTMMASAGCADRRDSERWNLEYEEYPSAEWNNDSLTLKFASRLSGKIKDGYSIYYAPVYKGSTGLVSFPEAGFYTRRELKFMQRREVFSDNKKEGLVGIKHKRTDTAAIRYCKTLYLPKDKSDGELVVKVYVRDCCNDEIYAVDTVAIVRQKVVLEERDSLLNLDYVAERLCDKQERLVFFYPVDLDETTPLFAGNDTVFHRLENILMPLLADTLSYRIERIEVKGYASPEAAFEYNLRLAERRAAYFRDYLQRTYPLQKHKIKIRGYGEDWDGLYKMLMEDASCQPYKAEMLDIIDRYGIFEGRERMLMELGKGVPYHELMKKNYPLLRRIELIIDYEIKPCNE